ncbi:MAG TPA: hypothetical protein VGD43_04985 [Micromonospora sp.]
MTAVLRRLTPVLAVLTVLTVLVGPLPATAAPSAPTPSGHEDGDEPPLLGDVLESANRSYVEAKAKLEKSRKRQLQLALEVERAQSALDALSPQVSSIAVQAYKTGRVGAMATLLESDSQDAFVARARMLDELNMVNAGKIAEFRAAADRAVQAKEALDAEVREQAKQAKIMATRKREAEKALALVGGEGLTKGDVVATSPVARVGPGRNPDGTWRPLSCTEDDPTTSGCVTPRTLHAYKEVKRAGFNRFVGCYRSGGPYEHPKGRACDWSLISRGFVSAQNRDQKMYGNNLTAFLVRNADRLGIYYVIWYRQIWFPATGWKSYSGASDHTDHVHRSML